MFKQSNSRNQSRLSRCVRVAVALFLFQWSLVPLSSIKAASDDSDELNSRPGNIKARGAFTCDFGLPGNLPLDQVAPIIERDRMYMAERPGMQRKQIPLAIDFATGNLLSGGRYLFDTKQDAVNYKAWIENDFALDGVHFFDRPIILSPACYSWGVIGAHNFKDLPQQVAVRTERWSVPRESQKEALKQKFQALLTAAEASGMTGVWLLYNKEEQLAQLVYFADRVVSPDPFASLGALQAATPLGATLNGQQGWTKTFDRTQLVLTVWFPFELGDLGSASLWPNSPPFPMPYIGDGVCEVSRGENYVSAPTDCGPTCGNKVCDAGENTQSCPGDCRLP